MGLASLLPMDFRRRRLANKVAEGPLRDYLMVPFPDLDLDYREIGFVALDLETTGLDAQKDHILSVGLVELWGERIELESASHRLVQSERPLPETSVVIHQITDDVAAQGEPIGEVLSDVLARLSGKVLLAHHAVFEVSFLRSACRRLFGGELLLPVVDTERLARRQMERRDEVIAPGALRLANLRQRYGLPRYRAHNALSDALATAELFLAQMAERSGGGKMPLRQIMLRL